MLKLTLALLLISPAKAFDLTEFYIEATKGIWTNRHVYIPEDEKLVGDLNLGFTMEKKFLYSRTNVDSFYTDDQFRYVSLTEEFGINLTRTFQVYFSHQSEHGLDYNTNFKYNNINVIGIRIYLLKKD